MFVVAYVCKMNSVSLRKFQIILFTYTNFVFPTVQQTTITELCKVEFDVLNSIFKSVIYKNYKNFQTYTLHSNIA